MYLVFLSNIIDRECGLFEDQEHGCTFARKQTYFNFQQCKSFALRKRAA